MTSPDGQLFLNSKYCIELLECTIINLYKNNDLNKIISKINYDNDITDIEFNPVKENIIVISFSKGYCKICNISDQGIEEKILFEGINNKKIKKSIFNEFNTNIIASLSILNKIIIWDVRLQKFENVMQFKERIIKIKWSKIFKNVLEVRTTNKIKLINSNNNNNISTFENIDNEIKNFSILTNDIIILIKKNKLEKRNKLSDKIDYLKITQITNLNESFIRNDFLIILGYQELYFVNVQSLVIDITFKCEFGDFYNFITRNDTDVTVFYYYLESEVFNKSFRLAVDMKKIDTDKSNFEENFYRQYEKKIYKYLCLLNFEENIEKEIPIYKKKYMKIKDIETFFDKIKKINIFDRKNLIEQILENKFINKEISEILKNDNFEYIKICFSLFNKEKENQQKEFISKMDELNKINKDFIKEMYFQLLKLLTIDNTNDKLLEIYLFFLNKYESTLIKDESLGEYIEKYESEVKYYYPCFSKERYKILFNIEKEGEKEIVLNFLQKAYEIKRFIIGDENLQVLADEALKLSLDLPDFNQPIEYDCKNIELRWHKIKTHLVETFKELKFEENKNFEKEKDKIQKALGQLKNGINIVMQKKLLKNDNILNNKYKLDCAILLIINPCNILNKEADFYSNLLICEPLDENKLYQLAEKDSLLKIDKDNNTLKVSYNNYNFKDPEYLCLDNLLNKHFQQDKKYNFDYLSKNCVNNQDKIKSFLKTILSKKVFLDIYEILFGNKEYKYLNKKYIDELIDNRIKFVPIGPADSLALSDKVSISTMISIKDKTIKDSNLYIEKNPIEYEKKMKY